MRLGYFADGPMAKDDSGNLYGQNYNDVFFRRYLAVADEVEICIRVNSLSEYPYFEHVTVPNVRCTACINTKSVKGVFHLSEAKKTVNDVISRCDIVIARIPSTIGSIAAKICKAQDKKYMIEMVGCPFDSLWNHSFRGKLFAGYSYLVAKNILKDSPAVIYVTESFLQKRYPTTGKSIGISSVNLPAVELATLFERKDKIRQENKPVVIGTTAAVNMRYKGHDTVFKALKILKDKGITHFRYELVGGGDNSRLKKLAKKYNIEEQVCFIGGLSHERVFEWLKTIDIYVQPSLTEGLPRALLEAMSMALPAIGSNAGGIPELLDASFVFSNGKKSGEKVAELLSSFDLKKMLEEAERNFTKCEDFQKEKLEKRRQDFICSYFGIFKKDDLKQ